MKQEKLRLNDAVALLERTPQTLRELLSGLPEIYIRATEGDATWTPYDVVGHLIHGERTDWIPRLRHILAEETRPFDPFDRTAQFRESQGKDLQDLLATFSELRRQSLAQLLDMNLTEQDFDRKGLHPSLGEVTLGQLLATWVVHDLDHLSQVIRTMAKVYTEQTGPWHQYLSVLSDKR